MESACSLSVVQLLKIAYLATPILSVDVLLVATICFQAPLKLSVYYVQRLSPMR